MRRHASLGRRSNARAVSRRAAALVCVVHLPRRAITSRTSAHPRTPRTARYGLLYDTILPQFRHEPGVRLFEIGLGCGMPYGEGHSAVVWRQYFKASDNFELVLAEFNEPCGRAWMEKHPGVADQMLFGDQSDVATLQAWMNASDAAARPFDIIIDDGGHSWKQQTVSFFNLWDSVAPGGFYFMEDLVCNIQNVCICMRVLACLFID